MAMFLWSQMQSQNDVLMAFFHFPMMGSPLWEPILRITTIKTADRRVFKMAAGCLKWFPTVLRDGFLTIQAPKMAAIWRIFTGLWVFNPLEHINRVLMHFNGFFIFTLWCFRWNELTSLSKAPLYLKSNFVTTGLTLCLTITLFPMEKQLIAKVHCLWNSTFQPNYS